MVDLFDYTWDCAGTLFCFQRSGSEPVPGCAHGEARGVQRGIDYCVEVSHIFPQPRGPWEQSILDRPGCGGECDPEVKQLRQRGTDENIA